MSDQNPEHTTHKIDPHTKEKWLKGLYLVLFFFIGYVVGCLVAIIAVFQFFSDVVLKDSNKNLLEFSKNMNLYFYQIVNYLTYNSEEKPYPFNPWPKG